MQHLTRTASAASPDGQLRSPEIAAFRQIERKRRLFKRHFAENPLPRWLFVRITCTSFRLENLNVSETEATAALERRGPRRALRSPHVLRIRNHAAILKRIERAVRRSFELKLPEVVRWYTSLSSGLSIGSVDGSRARQLQEQLRRINSPRLRVEPAIREAAAVHMELLSDPVFPGFNGLLARLLLEFHLGRCQLPPVTFDPDMDRDRFNGEAAFSARLVERILASYQALLVDARPL